MVDGGSPDSTILTLLADAASDGLRPDEIMQETGFSRTMTNRALVRLVKAGKVAKPSYGRYSNSDTGTLGQAKVSLSEPTS